MTENTLLVPMQLDVMVMNKMAGLTTPFLRFQMDYRQLRSFKSPEPAPFAGGSTKQPAAGAYLHWTLPRALRHGRHKDDGTTEFPLVPNRWLVTRTQEGVPPDRAVKAWILESDYVNTASGTSPYVDPGGMDAGGTPRPTKIGRALRLLPRLTSLATQPAPFLRAVGPGSVYFSIFSPGVENVLSFYDDLTADDDTTKIDQGAFTYAVTGWYSDPSHDPLRQTGWKPSNDPKQRGAWMNDTFDWLVYTDADAAELPKRMLVHTLVSNVQWNRGAESAPAANYPTDIQNRVKVSVGNTAVDALAGMIRLYYGGEPEADLLEAFQYGLLDELDKPGSAEALNMAIRQHWFAHSPGGTLWDIVPKERSGDTSLPAPPPPVITGPQSAALAALNGAQADLDSATRLLESMQWNLFSLWWKNKWQNYNNPPLDGDYQQWIGTQLPLQMGIDPNTGQWSSASCNDPKSTDPGTESWYVCKVTAQRNRVGKLTDARGIAKGNLAALLDPTQEIKSANLPEYFAPNDPVVLVTGLGRSTNFDPGIGILCRLPSQTVNVLAVSGVTYATDPTKGTDISSKIPKLNDPNGLLPEGAQALHIESFFLSPTLFAQDILGGADHATEVSKGIDALPKPAVGARFASDTHARRTWEQPWVPLLLDWEVTLLKKPAYDCRKGEPACTFNQGNWRFNGTDYLWTGPTTSGGGNFDETDSLQMKLSGRTFITPQLTFTLSEQLKEYVQKHKERDPHIQELLEQLEKHIEQIKGEDILSQRLSGLMGMTIQRGPSQNVPPSGDIADLIGEYRNGYPMPFPDEHASYAPSVWDFAPMRGTFFVINRLSVIDTFGRTINLMLANLSTNPQKQESVPEYYFYPIAGRDIKSPTAKEPLKPLGISSSPTDRMMQLTPRMVNDSQLRFRLISSDGTDTDIALKAGATPVCGWVVPNHLDRSLAFYAADGGAWGQLYLSLRFNQQYVPVWEPDPTNPAAPRTINEIPNIYVRQMLQTLAARSDNGKGFRELITVIDETLWTINPLGQEEDEHLSVLIGRPLAIVRTDMTLRTRGLFPVNQDWWSTFAVDPANLPDPTQPAPLAAIDGDVGGSQYLWPVRLGSPVLRDDGLIGYFLDDPTSPADTFSVFNTLRLAAGASSNYLKAIGDGNYVSLRYIDDATSPDPKKSQISRMTMLIDPRGSVHAFSGILPVVPVALPSRFVKPAMEKMFYTFRAGPLLASPDEIRVPRPAEQNGTWSWFDHVLALSVPLVDADGKVRFPTTPPLIKEGWLKFKPNTSNDHE